MRVWARSAADRSFIFVWLNVHVHSAESECSLPFGFVEYYNATQSQKAVTAYFTSKQLLPFGFAAQYADCQYYLSTNLIVHYSKSIKSADKPTAGKVNGILVSQ